MNRSGLFALLAIVVLGGGGYYYMTQMKKPDGAATDKTAATDTAPDQSNEPLLFTFENWTNPPFFAEYKEKYGVEPQGGDLSPTKTKPSPKCARATSPT